MDSGLQERVTSNQAGDSALLQFKGNGQYVRTLRPVRRFLIISFGQKMLFLVIAVTKPVTRQLPKCVRQLKPSLLLDKNNEIRFRD